MPSMPINTQSARQHLTAFAFKELFTEELGWSQPPRAQIANDGWDFESRQIAELAGAVVLEITLPDGTIPDARTRRAIDEQVEQRYREHLLVFLDRQRTQSLWYWVKRDGAKRYPREHWYFKGQPGDLFLSKISAMVVDISEFEAPGQMTVLQAAQRLQQALDVEPVTRKFYGEFRDQHIAFLQHIHGIDNERDRRWYASVLLNRLMFIYFLQRKGFLNNGDFDYLQRKLAESGQRGQDRYYSEFLDALFFEGFAKPEDVRDPARAALVGTIPYLNGGLFLQHRIEADWPNIRIPDEAFHNLFKLFAAYSWNLDDTPGGNDNELNPDVLGYIFEKYINQNTSGQKEFGAYYTRTQITEYLCEQTIHRVILERINLVAGLGFPARHFDSVPELLMHLDARLCHELLVEVLPNLSLLDPACGSGAFLVAAMKTLINIYSAVTGRIEFLNNPTLERWLDEARAEGPTLNYTIKKAIIVNNLFGVDIMEEATEIAKLRLFLALVSSVQRVDQLEPLPNIDFNILAGNSLIGLLHVDEAAINQRNLFQKPYDQEVAEKNRLIAAYREASTYTDQLQSMRDDIQHHRDSATVNLNDLLLNEFQRLGIKYEQATWDAAKNKEGKPVKRQVRLDDVAALQPFHWGYEFDQVMARGGFDAIITNPPWQAFKPQAKEFFQQYSTLVTKKKMTIKDFEEEQSKLLQDADIRTAWLEYRSRFPHINTFFRSISQYINQIPMIDGKKAITDINLYKLFLEQSFNLLRDGGQCGIVIPSGIYTDLGTKQLRELLFSSTQIGGLFCFENRKEIFEGVHRSFKFVVLTFEKGHHTEVFPGSFMRHDVTELDRFPAAGSLLLNVALIRRLSPDSLSIMEFKNETDVQIAEKALDLPLLTEEIVDRWNLVLGREFHTTDDRELFLTEPSPGRLPLYEGKMIHQFTHCWGEPKYWIDEQQGRNILLEDQKDNGQKLPYQMYRLVYRRQSATTNERTLISTIIPPAFQVDNLATALLFSEDGDRLIDDGGNLFLCAIFNSLVIDYMIRTRVTNNINYFYIYQLPVPRLTERDPQFRPIVERAARLICTTPEFDELAQAVGLGDHTAGATDAAERAALRAELDGMIAHLYGLSEAKFTHILATFPLVAQTVKDAALAAYRAFAPNPDDQQVAEIIRQGERAQIEFKVAALTKPSDGSKDGTMPSNIVQSVASYLNSREGGTLIIGVQDDGTVRGLAQDYVHANKQKASQDGYALWLDDTLGNQLGNQWRNLWSITFHQIDGHEVCRVRVQPAPEPVYLNGDLYVRGNQGKKKLTAQESIVYISQRWG